MNRIAILYISGAGLDTAIWDAVKAQVATPGYDITHSRSKDATLEGAVQEGLEQVQSITAEKYIIVAHSLGGVIGIELARRLGDKLAGFVALSAAIPKPGKSFVAALPFPQKLILPLVLRLVGTKPPVSAIRSGLCSDLGDAQANAIIEAFTPEPLRLYIDTTTQSALPQVDYLYIRSLKDKEFSPQLQSAMMKQLPDAKVVDIESGHMAMINRTDELAAALNDFIASAAP
ncbi:MAG TPA: alpha/beta hydrolase [Candidatus Saccharimonadales bacterium]|nr:alpha/beta hydrolase [Candidatus Saccharimonadales bacterium]